MKIWCPACEWKPTPTDRWWCGHGGCGHSWNTFDTGGVCPACSKIWKITYCYGCRTGQPHIDWYHDDPGVDQVSADDQIDLEIQITELEPVEANS